MSSATYNAGLGGPDDPFGSGPLPPLPSARRIEILLAYAILSNPRHVGRFLHIAPSTVRNTLAELRSEFNVDSSLKAFVVAEVMHLIEPDDIEVMRIRIIEWRTAERENRW